MFQFILDKVQTCSHRLLQSTSFGQQCVFNFHESNIADKFLPGSKPSVLCEMASLGLPIPPGFIIATDCGIDENLINECKYEIAKLETVTGRTFGESGKEQPETSKMISLLLCVRSGEENLKLLNLGMNNAVVRDIWMSTGDKHFALDLYRHFLALFGVIVLQKRACLYEEALDRIMKVSNASSDEDLTINDLESLVTEYKAIANFDEIAGEILDTAIPDDPFLQFEMAIHSIGRQTSSSRIAANQDQCSLNKQKLRHVIIVDAMVFGNMNGNSGCGTVYSRNPETGENIFTGEYFRKAQGKVTVSPPRTPSLSLHNLETDHPETHLQLANLVKKLEHQFNEVQKLTFTIEDGHLFVLQAQPALRSPKASARIAVEMVKEGSTSKSEAILKLNPKSMSYFLHSMVDPDKDVSTSLVGHGRAYGVGAVSGRAVFSAEEIIATTQANLEPCILIAKDLTKGNLFAAGMDAASGVLIMRGVRDKAFDETSTIGLDKCVITEVQDCCSLFLSTIDAENNDIKGSINSRIKLVQSNDDNNALRCTNTSYNCVRDSAGQVRIAQGQFITLDGATGRILEGTVPKMEPAIDRDFTTVLQWTKQYRRMDILGTCDTTNEVQEAMKFGAEGIGLLRIEHLLQATVEGRDVIDRLLDVGNSEEQSQSLFHQIKHILNSQLKKIFFLVPKKPVTILLHDLQLKSKTTIDDQCPPIQIEFISSQVRAIISAALASVDEDVLVLPRIAIPFTASEQEIWRMATLIHSIVDSTVATEQQQEAGSTYLQYEVGVVLATPRSCLRARYIAAQSTSNMSNIQFVIFDTDALTKLMWGLPRDSGTLPLFRKASPFETIDQRGVGEMIWMANRMFRIENPAITVGMFGSHTNDAASVKYFDRIGLDNISCQGIAIPGAKLAAAQGYIQHIWCSRVASEDQYAQMPCDITDTLFDAGAM